jgi:alkanesulfonate monooxygenase SsuD/methylene tetrahydromethanopterin reductase-like flavin-dependent oxidoreductase (luciferase family)
MRGADGLAIGAGEPPTEEAARETFILCGSPESVSEQILQFKDECDVDRVDLLAHIPGLSHAAVQQTLTLYASEVARRVGVSMLSSMADPVGA